MMIKQSFKPYNYTQNQKCEVVFLFVRGVFFVNSSRKKHMFFQTPMVQIGAGQKFHAALVSTGPNIYHDTLTYIRPITTGAVDINLKNRFFFVRVTIANIVPRPRFTICVTFYQYTPILKFSHILHIFT